MLLFPQKSNPPRRLLDYRLQKPVLALVSEVRNPKGVMRDTSQEWNLSVQ